jgi:hypothetical protein
LKFPHRFRARRTGTALLVAAAVSPAPAFMSGAAGPIGGLEGRVQAGTAVAGLAVLRVDFGRD